MVWIGTLAKFCQDSAAALAVLYVTWSWGDPVFFSPFSWSLREKLSTWRFWQTSQNRSVCIAFCFADLCGNYV